MGSISGTARPLFCTACGARLEPTSRFCEQCGKEIDQQPAQPGLSAPIAPAPPSISQGQQHDTLASTHPTPPSPPGPQEHDTLASSHGRMQPPVYTPAAQYPQPAASEPSPPAPAPAYTASTDPNFIRLGLAQPEAVQPVAAPAPSRTRTIAILTALLIVLVAAAAAGAWFLFLQPKATITVEQPSLQCQAGATVQVSAGVAGNAANVSWIVREGPSGGRVVAEGAVATPTGAKYVATYVAPFSPGVYHVEASTGGYGGSKAVIEIRVLGAAKQ